MRKIIRAGFGALTLLLAAATSSWAQQPVKLCIPTQTLVNGALKDSCQPVDSGNPLPTTGGGGGGSVTITTPLGHGTADAAAVAIVPSATASFPLAAGSALVGQVGIDQTTPGTTNAVVASAAALGGSLAVGSIVPNNTTAVVVKASHGTLYGVQLFGIGSAPAYLKIYNAASATCGSGTPLVRLGIPAASTAANGAGSNVTFGPVGIAMGTGITYCVTTGIADADATAPAATSFLVNLDYQ